MWADGTSEAEPPTPLDRNNTSDVLSTFNTRPVQKWDMDTEKIPQEITTLVGREVYSNNGVFVGEVEDIRLDLDRQSVTGLALHQLNAELFDAQARTSRGVIMPYRWVQAVGDVIIVNDIIERLRQPEADEDEEEVAA